MLSAYEFLEANRVVTQVAILSTIIKTAQLCSWCLLTFMMQHYIQQAASREQNRMHTFPKEHLGCSEKRIRELEKFLGRRLPEDYKDFLLSINEGMPEKRYFSFKDTRNLNGESVINIFFELEDAPEIDISETSLAKKYRFRVDDDRIPQFVLPIADDIGGNLICLDLRTPPKGPVAYWDHEREHLKNCGIFNIARNFTEFVSSLYNDEQFSS